MKNILILTTLLCLIAACEEKNGAENKAYLPDTTNDANANDMVEMPSDSVFYLQKGFNKTIPGCVNENTNCATFMASFPLIDDLIHGKVADSVNNFIRSKLYAPLIGEKQANGINDLLAPYFAAYKTTLADAQEEGIDSVSVWYYTRNFSVLQNTYWLFTIKHFEHSYTGGPHPNSFNNFYHFNPINGKRIYLSDVFKAGYEKKLTQLVEKKLRRQLKISATASLEDAGFYEDKFELTENFWVDEEGLVFVFNPYEVTSAAVGAIEIKVNYSEIEGMLQPAFDPQKRVINDKNHPSVAHH